MNTSKVQSASIYQGLGYLPPQNGSLAVSSFSLGATTASSIFSITLPVSVNDAATGVMIMFSGITNAFYNNQWAIINKTMYVRNTDSDIYVVVKRGSGNITIQWQYYNSSGAGKTVPAQTVSTRVFPYTAPWD